MPTTQAWYLVALCTLAFFFSYIDRQIVSLLIEPIKADLKLSDTQFGLLQGLAFSMFYAVMGLPVAAASDRVSRPMIIALGLAVWSAATMACGLARGFGQMLLARMMVGAGEASLSPATYSLISDLFPRRSIGRATAVFSMGSFLGAGFAYLVGGAMIAALQRSGPIEIAGQVIAPWRVVMLIVGAPGLLLALLILLTGRDPGRAKAAGAPVPSNGEVMGFLKTHAGIFVPHILGYSLYAMALFAVLSWSPAYLGRIHGFTTAQTGLVLGPMALLASGGGALVSGFLLDRATRLGRPDGPFKVGAYGALGVIVAAIALVASPNLNGALVALALAFFFTAFPMAPSAAVIQTLAPGAMRSRISAIFLFFNSFIGLALGSALVGMLNDAVFGVAQGLRYSLPLVAGGAAACAFILLWRGARPYARAMAVNPAEDARP